MLRGAFVGRVRFLNERRRCGLLFGAVLVAEVAEVTGADVGVVVGEVAGSAVTGSAWIAELAAEASVATVDDEGLAG